MDFRGSLEVDGLEDGPEAKTHSRPRRNLGGNEAFSGSTPGGQETEGE